MSQAMKNISPTQPTRGQLPHTSCTHLAIQARRSIPAKVLSEQRTKYVVRLMGKE
jgi:hypothetical protein